MTPSLIAGLLDSRAFAIFARIVLTFVFWGAGLDKLNHFDAAVAEMAHVGLNPPAVFAILTIATLLVSSVLIIANVAAWLGYGALGVFLVLTIPLAHPFWAASGDEAVMHFRVAVEHVSLIGGLMTGAILSHRTRAAKAPRSLSPGPATP
ncbi:DoxX family protein [Aquabacter spiritensis]|uniref:Transmembrane protein n=1 Tax=Aquabacter spiritensis TaxID=933073 RepID=A0A4R3LSA3_9HYPH|nr:DoxX family protein [Aquabacter spiritensis]TCT03241.1 transmembrane protein [Aquabacter spiritensis]